MVFLRCAPLLEVTLLLALTLSPLYTVRADDEPAKGGDEAGKEGEEEDKGILSQLTITLGSDAVDERSFLIRDSDEVGKKKIIRLGNVKGHEESAEGYEDKVDKGSKAFKAFVEKQMIFWKAFPDEYQTKEMGGEKKDIPIIVADVWTIDGRHVNSNLAKAGHLVEDQVYESEHGKDILMADADAKKKDSYKELEEALKANNEAEKAKKNKRSDDEDEDEVPEPLGFSGWVGLSVIGILFAGIFTNFGRGNQKKGRPGSTKKKGMFATLLGKIKGS